MEIQTAHVTPDQGSVPIILCYSTETGDILNFYRKNKNKRNKNILSFSVYVKFETINLLRDSVTSIDLAQLVRCVLYIQKLQQRCRLTYQRTLLGNIPIIQCKTIIQRDWTEVLNLIFWQTTVFIYLQIQIVFH